MVGPKKVSPTQLLLLIIRTVFVIRLTFVIIAFVPTISANRRRLLNNVKVACKKRKEKKRKERRNVRKKKKVI